MLVQSLSRVRRAHNTIVELHNTSMLEEILIPKGAVIGIFEGIPQKCDVHELSIPKSMAWDPSKLDRHLISVCGVSEEIDNNPLLSSLGLGETKDKVVERLSQPHIAESLVELPKLMGENLVIPPENSVRRGVDVETPSHLVEKGKVNPFPSDIKDKGDLPWGMKDPGWTEAQRAMVITFRCRWDDARALPRRAANGCRFASRAPSW